MAVPAQLFHLEQLDAEIARLTAELADVRRRQQRNPQLDAAEKQLDQLREQERAAAAQQRTLEVELADLEAKIKRDQGRLYGGQVVDPREIGSLQRELEHYNAQRDAVEERLLTAMEQQETLQSQLAERSQEINALRARWDDDRPALARQAEQTADTLAGLRAERDSLATQIPASTLSLYQRLRQSSGHAVSTVSNGVCQWCRVNLPPRDVQHARAGALVTCTNCSRILHVSHER